MSALHQAAGLVDARSRGLRARPLRGKRIGLVSGKGGVGKSAIAVNVAVAAASRGIETLLVDGDAGLANADLLMGLVPEWTLSEACAERCPFESVVTSARAGLDLVVSGAGPAATERLRRVVEGADAGAGFFERFVASRPLTILDLGAGIGDAVVELAIGCDRVWLVATPEPTSLADAYTMARRLWERRPSLQVELVVNRVADEASAERTHQALTRLTRRFLGRALPRRASLPEDPAMGWAVSRQTPVVESAPMTPIARRLASLAETLTEELCGGPLATERLPG